MAKRPYVKIYVDDFFGSFKVQQMKSAEVIGAYFLMLMYASQEDDIGLPDDNKELASITKLGRKFSKYEKILKSCFYNENNRLYNSKLISVLSKYEKTVDGSKKAITKRWSKEEVKNDTNVLQTENGRNTNHKPITINHKPINKIESSAKAPHTKFVKPKDWKVVGNYIFEYLKEKGVIWAKELIQQEAEKFFNHYTANGWKVGGKASMKDWEAAARNWVSNVGGFGKEQPAQQPKKTVYLDA